MELMIKHSEILTIMIQAFMITAILFICINCMNEFRMSRKPIRKGQRHNNLSNKSVCPECEGSAWTSEHITAVKTKPMHCKVRKVVVNERC